MFFLEHSTEECVPWLFLGFWQVPLACLLSPRGTSLQCLCTWLTHIQAGMIVHSPFCSLAFVNLSPDSAAAVIWPFPLRHPGFCFQRSCACIYLLGSSYEYVSHTGWTSDYIIVTNNIWNNAFSKQVHILRSWEEHAIEIWLLSTVWKGSCGDST